MNNYKYEERIVPLSLRGKSSNPVEILRDWFRLTYGDKHKEIRDRIFTTRTKVYVKYDNIPYFSFQRAMVSVKNRWCRLPKTLKRSEPHIPINLEALLYRAPKYIQLEK